MLNISNLAFQYGSLQVFRNVTYEAQSGQLVGVFGPNGSGKTTLFRPLMALLRPQAGSIHWNGHDVNTAGKKLPKKIIFLTIFFLSKALSGFCQISMDSIVLLAFNRHSHEIEFAFKSFSDDSILYFISMAPSDEIITKKLTPQIDLKTIRYIDYLKWQKREVPNHKIIIYIENIKYEANSKINFYVTCGILSIKKKKKLVQIVSENIVISSFNCSKEKWEYQVFKH